MADRLARWPALAAACGYDPTHTISASQLYRRRDQLGLVAYFVTFCALVWQSIRRGVIRGKDLVLDSSLIDAFSRQDPDAAWHFAKRFGYKVHLLICRDALLPVMFLVTPANRNDAPWAIPLLELFRHCVVGLYKVWRHAFEVCIAVLTVAWLAADIGRPDLMHSKARLLAPC